jgi:toxin CcdB
MYEVHALRRDPRELVIVLQDDLLSDLETRVVAPLVRRRPAPPIERLAVPVEIEGKALDIRLDRLAAIPARDLGPIVVVLSDVRARVGRGVDLLFFGV